MHTLPTEKSTLSLHDALPISTAHIRNPTPIEVPQRKGLSGRGTGPRSAGRPIKGEEDEPSPVVLPERIRSEEHTSELQSHSDLVCRLLLEKKNMTVDITGHIE